VVTQVPNKIDSNLLVVIGRFIIHSNHHRNSPI